MSTAPAKGGFTASPDPPAYSPNDDDRLWALIAHLSPFVAGLTGLSFLGPLVVWLMKKDSPFVEDQAKEALNFQLAVYIAVIVLCVTCIGIPVAVVVAIAAIIYPIVAAIEANKGVYYRFPYSLRLIK